jgi:hypothetical protein
LATYSIEKELVVHFPAAMPGDVRITGALQLEIVASFDWTAAAAAAAASGGNKNLSFGVSVLGGAANLTVDCMDGASSCQGSADRNSPGCGVVAAFLEPFSNEAIILPRQARDKHRIVKLREERRFISCRPLMPLEETRTRLHAIIDGTITEAIWNNRTAMVVYVPPTSAAATAVTLFGVGSGIKCTIETWALTPANNLVPFVPPHAQ